MLNETSISNDSSTSSKKKAGGGKAIGGGMNFQANTTVIVAVHILRGIRLEWVDGTFDDIPLAVWAESEGSGDDIRIEFKDNVVAEAQVKKGLKRNDKLWDSLEAMAKAIDQKEITYGFLVVASDSSNTIKNDLAVDIKRLGQGRDDNLSDIGREFRDRLIKLNISAKNICSHMRIRVIHALSQENTSILAAKEILRSVCSDKKDVYKVWDALYRHSLQLIESRGRLESKDLVQILSSMNIKMCNDGYPASILGHQTEWVKENNSYFFITGTKRKIPIKYLLPMKVEKISFSTLHANDVSTALSNYNYQKNVELKSNIRGFDSVWIGRFIKHVVVVAGPGLGKSTMIRELAYQYAQDGYLVLKIDLKKIAVALNSSKSFSESLITLSLDGSGIIPEHVGNLPLSNCVILADGLDECGSSIHDVAEKISHFVQGHPDVRVIITTRPIGYSTAEFERWHHYRLLPPVKEQGAKNLAHLMTVIAQKDFVEENDEIVAERELGHTLEEEAFANSPQLLGMAASLLNKNHRLPKSRTQLYQHLISLFDFIPKEQDDDSQQDVHDLVINIVGWELICNQFIDSNKLIDECAAKLAEDMGITKLAAKGRVRDSIKHWERLGLIEKINYQSTSLITFFHKTFSEFVAARFLCDNHQKYLEEVIDKPEWSEVVNFASGIGLADEVIKIKLRYHCRGESKNLRDALSVLGKHSNKISNPLAEELIDQAITEISNSSEESFILGISLSDLVSMLSNDNSHVGDIIKSAVSTWLNSPNNDLYLIGWGIVVKAKDCSFDAEIVSNALKNAKSYVKIPSITEKFTEKKDRSNLKLLERIALAALKAQSDDKIKEFYYSELKGQGILTYVGRIACEIILEDRGIEIEKPQLSKFNSNKYPIARIVCDDSAFNPFWNVCYAIAKAIVNNHKDPITIPHHKGKFPNFTGLLTAVGYLDVPITYLYDFDVKYEEKAFCSIIKSIVKLLPLDSYALLNEAIELINILEKDPSLRVLTLLPKVDILEVKWEKSLAININKEYMKKMLFHPSPFIALLAINFFEHTPLSKVELTSLLAKADGFILSAIFNLANIYYPEDAFEMISVRLRSHISIDVTHLFRILQQIKEVPTQQFVEEVIAILASDNDESVISAANLLSDWSDLDVDITLGPIIKAIEFWQRKEERQKSFLMYDPLTKLIELKDKIILR